MRKRARDELPSPAEQQCCLTVLQMHHGAQVASVAKQMWSLGGTATLAELANEEQGLAKLLRLECVERRGQDQFRVLSERVLGVLRYGMWCEAAEEADGVKGRQAVERAMQRGGGQWRDLEKKLLVKRLCESCCDILVRAPSVQATLRKVIELCAPTLYSQEECELEADKIEPALRSVLPSLKMLNKRPWLEPLSEEGKEEQIFKLTRLSLLWEPAKRLILKNVDAERGVVASQALDLLLRSGPMTSKELAGKLTQEEPVVRQVLNALLAEGLVMSPAVAATKGKQFAHYMYCATLEKTALAVMASCWTALSHLLTRLLVEYDRGNDEKTCLLLHHHCEQVYSDIVLLRQCVASL